MHIEKNICDNVLGTILDLKKKNKDNLDARLDLEALGVRSELHATLEGGKYKIPAASFSLSLSERDKFYLFLKNLKVPDGFSSNISHSVNLKERKLSGLKSHDCHVILHHLLAIALRGLLPEFVCEPLIELSLFFNVLGSKSLKIAGLEAIHAQIPITLCKLERIFPPTFFNVMEHLPIHLAEEAKVAGPVHFRWMYPIERYLYTLKSYIRNRTHPEGSIAEGYIANECTNLFSRYMEGMETRFNRPNRNYEGDRSGSDGGLSIFENYGRPLGAGIQRDPEDSELEQAHNYILNNCEEVQHYIEDYNVDTATTSRQHSRDDRMRDFKIWFKNRVISQSLHSSSKKLQDLLSLARGPAKNVSCFRGYVTKGYRFQTEHNDRGMRTQNCGVIVAGQTGSGSEEETFDYYGKLTEIIELQYLNDRRVVLFRCIWCDVYDRNRGVKEDKYGYMSVNFQRSLKTNEPFVLASQASQVFYMEDNAQKGWHVVRKMQPRDLYEMPAEEDLEPDDIPATNESFSPSFEAFTSSNLNWQRTDVEAAFSDSATLTQKRKR